MKSTIKTLALATFGLASLALTTTASAGNPAREPNPHRQVLDRSSELHEEAREEARYRNMTPVSSRPVTIAMDMDMRQDRAHRGHSSFHKWYKQGGRP